MIAAMVADALAGATAVVAQSAQVAVVRQYMRDLQGADYDAAFRLLNPAARAYFRRAANFRSVYLADEFAVEHFTVVGQRIGTNGSVYLVRETARFRDHAHDVDLVETATISIGVVAAAEGWRIKDPGHPWRALSTRAIAERNGLTIRVKKLSFFARRIEAVIAFQNRSPSFVTLLPYDKSVLRDASGTPYAIVETHDWSLTDKVLFEGLRLAPNAQYTGTLTFACGSLDERKRQFTITIAPIIFEGADRPFSLDVTIVAAVQ